MYKLSHECPQGSHGGGVSILFWCLFENSFLLEIVSHGLFIRISPPPNELFQVQALCSLNDNVLVSGANDNSMAVWVRCENGREFTCKYLSLEHHQGMLRALVAVPPCGLCPQGGFASGCLDKQVRLFSYNPATHEVNLVKTLSGHQGGVDSLAVHPTLGYLLSGGRDGQARVWELSGGSCLQVLGDHENTTRVCGLVDGGIATGSAGRKDERGQHVDYKLRLWALTTTTTGPPHAWALKKTLTDHEQAIQDLDAMPGGVAFLSSSNDGTVRVRSAGDGAPLERMSTPLGPEGAPLAVYRGRLLPNMWVAGCCEDNRVRLWAMEALPGTVGEVLLPGTPWAVKGLDNGDIVIACTHAASGRKGHVYVFTCQPERYASAEEMSAFEADMLPPPKDEGGGGGGGGGGSAVGGGLAPPPRGGGGGGAQEGGGPTALLRCPDPTTRVPP